MNYYFDEYEESEPKSKRGRKPWKKKWDVRRTTVTARVTEDELLEIRTACANKNVDAATIMRQALGKELGIDSLLE